MWYVCDVLYAVLYVRVSCFVVRGCGVSTLSTTSRSHYVEYIVYDF